jgi:4-amino-4-deoxy-L-arabinose transferase-like glycosyltransferase
MPTAEHSDASGSSRPWSRLRPARGEAGGAASERSHGSRGWAWSGLAVVLAGGLALRLWGVGQGLPYVYNIDEAGHFVPKAVEMFSHGHNLNPHYFVNPPALTYVLHLVFAVWLGGGHGVLREYGFHANQVFLVARVTVALLGTAAVWLLYLLGARLFDRRVGLLAAAIEAVAFLPVFYGHFALNDAATLLPLTLSLLGSAGVLRRGRNRDYALAGLGLGLACASKYTAGIAIVPLAAAVAAHYLASTDGMPTHPMPTHPGMTTHPGGPRVLAGLAIAGGCALGAFLVANPYALLDFQRFHTELVHQSSLAGEAQGKLGAPKQGGLVYYLWSFTWGLGWAPALAALGGAIAIWRRDARIGWLLVPAPILFLGFMGLQDRYFGRWLLPIFPIVCLLAAYFAYVLVGAVTERAQRRGQLGADETKGSAGLDAGSRSHRAAVIGVLASFAIALVLVAQGLVYSVHNDLVLARADTRNLTRTWMVAHVPPGARIVLEPVVLKSWIEEGEGASRKERWVKYPATRSVIAPDGSLAPQTSHNVALEDYETTLSPALIGWYERQGYCWVVSGSTESGRAFADPRAAPLAVAYYRALAAQAEVAYRVSPYGRGRNPVGFNFDWTFDYYPLSYERPGPQMTVYRLLGGRCARGL